MITNLRQLDLNLLLIFDALMQEQNLSRAALRLHLSQSTVSNALARLRQQLGEALFQRTARGMVPTPRAQAIYGSVRESLHLLRVGLGAQDVIDLDAELTFSISMNDYAQAVFLPDLLSRVQEQAPRFVISVQSDDADTLARRLRVGELDLAIDYLHFDDDDLRYQSLGEQQLVVIARRDHPAIKNGLTLAMYQKCQHVSVRSRAGRGSPLEIVLGSAKVRRKVQLYVPNYLPIPALVVQSDMLGTVPRQLAEHFAHQYPLKIFPLPLEMPALQVSLIWHKQQDIAAGLQWLKAQIMQTFHNNILMLP